MHVDGIAERLAHALVGKQRVAVVEADEGWGALVHHEHVNAFLIIYDRGLVDTNDGGLIGGGVDLAALQGRDMRGRVGIEPEEDLV